MTLPSLLQRPAWLLFGLALLAHLPALRAVEFHYDDGHSLVRNPHVDDLANLPRFFTDPTLFSENPADAMYRPVVLVAHALNRSLSSDHPAGFLAMNLALHVIAALLLLFVLTSLFSRGGAFFGAALYAIHLLQTEVVNYVSARSESLAAVGMLLAVLSFLHYRTSGKNLWLIALVGGQLLALGSKEVAIVTPLLLLSIHWAVPAGRGRAARIGQLISAAIVVPYLILYQSFRSATSDEPVRSVGPQMGTQVKALIHYVRGFAIPVDLSISPQFSEGASLLTGPVPIAAGVLASLALLLWRCRRLWPAFGLGALWWLICLSPTLIVPLNVLVNDHRPYLALGGIAMALGALGLRPSSLPDWILKGALPLVLVALTWQRAADWRTEISLWESAVREGPEVAAAHHNLAFAYHQKSRTQLARRHYEQAIELKPDYLRPLTNLGAIYRNAGELDRAEEVLSRAARSDPGSVEALNNLGLVFAARGQAERAMDTYKAALRVDPGVADVWFNLGLAQRDAGLRQHAVQSLQRALQLDPEIRQRVGGSAP